ncbi:transporter substrate-binding domain-containing protein [Phyllobacterium myrsinacearum]|uniref:Polar amino acid transport system substrate-binding protein n=1 Tax=Phyllobacterium myrsinacearum TaxID=28101 RepID=A0A839EMK8_9HYPH|nr:polar amino acid transport system substrate-binding protein [Phyllobacterium myrsinacearum]
MTPVQADATLDRIKERGTLVAGVILSGPPYGYIDPKTQQQEGLNLDLAREFAKRLGVKLETVAVTPPNRVQFLQQGKVDLLLANMQWTQERAEILSFVPTAFEVSGGAAVVRKDSGIKDWADLRGKTVCVSQGSNFTKPLIEEYGAIVKGFPGQPDSLLALKGGNCDAAVHVGATVKLMLKQRADEWKDYEVSIPTELIPSDSVVWLRKGEADTQAALDQIMKNLHGSGWMIATAEKDQLPVSPFLIEAREKYKVSQ